jgi:hypothetical protein
MDFIEAFFEHWGKKIFFLRELFDSGHQDEAAILCYVYVDGFGHSLFRSTKSSASRFVLVLCEYGQNPFLPLIHPKGLIRWLQEENESAKYKALASKLEALWSSRKLELIEKNEFRELMLPHLTQQEAAIFEKELWRSTLAKAAYDWLRNKFIHTLRGYGGLSFDGTTYQGKPIPDIGFSTIYDALLHIVQYARLVSERSGKLFPAKRDALQSNDAPIN